MQSEMLDSADGCVSRYRRRYALHRNGCLAQLSRKSILTVRSLR